MPEKVIVAQHHSKYSPPFEMLGNNSGIWRYSFLEQGTKKAIFNGNVVVDCDSVNGTSSIFNSQKVKDSLINKINELYLVQSENFKFTFNSQLINTSPYECRVQIDITSQTDNISEPLKVFIFLMEEGLSYSKLTNHPWNIDSLYFHQRDIGPLSNNNYGFSLIDYSNGIATKVSATFSERGTNTNTSIQSIKQTRIIAMVQGVNSKKIYGTYKSTMHPFQDNGTVDIKKIYKKDININSKIVNNNLSINIPGEYSFSVYNMSGKEILMSKSKFYKANENLDLLEMLNEGIYAISIKGKNVNQNIKTLITKEFK